jgi:cell division septation protein DedD
MSSPSNKSVNSKSFLSVQTIVLSAVSWAVLALLFFLLFSVSAPGEERPAWYAIGTYIFEEVAYLGAAILCLRNWRSPQIVSGRNVWLGIGLGMLSYFLGNLVLGYWELGLGQDPEVSPGDIFFVATYLFLGWGILLAVLSRRLNLENWQWGVVGAIAVIGGLLAWLVAAPVEEPQSFLMSPAMAQTAAAPKTTAQPRAVKAPPLKPVGATPAAKTPAVTPAPTTTPESAEPAPPAWVTSVEATLAPLETVLNWFYIVSDLALLIIATVLLLAFWGGRFSQSWRMIAAAAFSLYIADIWFQYAQKSIPDYQTGSLPEVFWVFSGVLFGIGAALEHDLSTRSRRTPGRRRA